MSDLSPVPVEVGQPAIEATYYQITDHPAGDPNIDVAYTPEIAPGVLVDIDSYGRVIGIERIGGQVDAGVLASVIRWMVAPPRDAQSVPSNSQDGHSGTDIPASMLRVVEFGTDDDDDAVPTRFIPALDDSGHSGTDEDAYEVAAAGYVAKSSLSDDDPVLPECVYDLKRDVAFREAIDRALTQDRARLAELLRLAASGRRRYARTPHSHAEHLEHEAVLLDMAADVVAGDLTPMQSWLPSWMWTDEIREAGRG